MNEYSTFEFFTLQVELTIEVFITYLFFIASVVTTFIVYEYYISKMDGLKDIFSKEFHRLS